MRAPSSTLDELLQSAGHELAACARGVVPYERGVRGFDPAARNLLDIAAVPLVRMRTNLPILVDPSHGVGVRAAIPAMALVAIAVGADGLMLERHPDAGLARSDGPQALSLEAMRRRFEGVRAVAAAIAPARSAFAAE